MDRTKQYYAKAIIYIKKNFKIFEREDKLEEN